MRPSSAERHPVGRPARHAAGGRTGTVNAVNASPGAPFPSRSFVCPSHAHSLAHVAPWRPREDHGRIPVAATFAGDGTLGLEEGSPPPGCGTPPLPPGVRHGHASTDGVRSYISLRTSLAPIPPGRPPPRQGAGLRPSRVSHHSRAAIVRCRHERH